MVKSSKENLEKINISSDDIPRLTKQVEKTDINTLVRYIHIFSELSNEIKFATQKRVLVEIALIRLMTPQMDSDYDSLLERIRLLEDQIDKGVLVQGNNDIPRNSNINHNIEVKNKSNVLIQNSNKEEQDRIKEIAKVLPEDMKQIGRNWQKIVKGVYPSWRPNLETARPRVGKDSEGKESILILSCSDKMDLEIIGSEGHLAELRSVISQVIGKKIELEIQLKVDNNQEDLDNTPDLEKVIKHIEIEYED